MSDADVIVIGSGFGGSVAALRLAEKGYQVTVLEAGRRFKDQDLPETSWDVKNYLWAPQVGLFGIQRIHFLKDVMILAGAGVGGGSLNYANTLYRPPKAFFDDVQWAGITDWHAELTRHYDTAEAMLGVVTNPTHTPSDEVMVAVADRMGVPETFRPTPVGVFFGAKTGAEGTPGETVPDPYFGGVGPDRTACTECGSCMTGCRVGAKNTLVKNYLALAEQAGVDVQPMTTVTGLAPQPDGSWLVRTKTTGAWGKRHRRTLLADQVVVAAGAWGTQNLLHRAVNDGTLPRLSQALGRLTRTNSESILGAGTHDVDPDRDFSTGVAITSSIHPSDDTHVEACRYGPGSNLMGLLQTVITTGQGNIPRWLKALGHAARNPKELRTHLKIAGWSQRTIIALVMQTKDNSLTTSLRRLGPLRWLSSQQGHGEPNPTWIPAGVEATKHMADVIGGIAGGTAGELVNMPMTAHFLGGCPIGSEPESGVVDPYHRTWGYPTLHIVDGSTVSANLGVNPSLTITAQAERAMSLWPNKGQHDARPAQGDSYRRITPIPPHAPVVPRHSRAALPILSTATSTRTATSQDAA